MKLAEIDGKNYIYIEIDERSAEIINSLIENKEIEKLQNIDINLSGLINSLLEGMAVLLMLINTNIKEEKCQ